MQNQNANKFLKSIHGEGSINFRVIKDFPKNLKGTYEELEEKLIQYNKQGFNIYHQVNDGGTHTNEITKINAVFIDFDCGKDENKKYFPLDVVSIYKDKCIVKVNSFKYEPTYIIETRNGYHVYWLVNNATNEEYLKCQLQLIEYFHSDESIKDLTRIMRIPEFYWCKDINNPFMCNIHTDNNVKYEIADIMNELPQIIESNIKTKNNNMSEIHKVKNDDYKEIKDNVELIKCGLIKDNYKLLQNRIEICRIGGKGVGNRYYTNIGVSISDTLNPNPEYIPQVEFKNNEDIYDYLKKQDLHEFLGIWGQRFSCIFHKDENPSANIYKDEITGYWWYKCFSSKCCLKNAKDIIALTERLLRCTTPKALNFLRKVYNMKYTETEWEREQKDILDANIELLMNDDRLKEMYPKVYKRLYYYKDMLIKVNLFAKTKIFTENFSDNENQALFFLSLKKLGELSNCKNDGRVSQRMSLFAFMGMLNKLDETEIPDFLLKSAKHYSALNKKVYLTNYYSIPSYNDIVMEDAEDMSSLFEEKNMSMKGWSRELLIRTFGENDPLVDKLYPQMKNKKLTEKSEEFSIKFDELILKLIEEKGYATEKEVSNLLNGYKELNKIKIKRVLQETMDKYDLERIRCNKEVKNTYNVDVEGYPFIIIKASVK